MQGAMRVQKGSLITQPKPITKKSDIFPDMKKEVWLQSKYYFRGRMHSYNDPFVHTLKNQKANEYL